MLQAVCLFLGHTHRPHPTAAATSSPTRVMLVASRCHTPARLAPVHSQCMVRAPLVLCLVPLEHHQSLFLECHQSLLDHMVAPLQHHMPPSRTLSLTHMVWGATWCPTQQGMHPLPATSGVCQPLEQLQGPQVLPQPPQEPQPGTPSLALGQLLSHQQTRFPLSTTGCQPHARQGQFPAPQGHMHTMPQMAPQC